MLDTAITKRRNYVFVMSNDFEYPYKTFKGVKVIKMILCPKESIYYCSNFIGI